MAKIAARNEELRNRSEFKCRLFEEASLDEECRKIQNGTDLENSRVGDSKLREDFRLLEKHERVESNMGEIQMSAKDFLDQIIADRELICNEGVRVEEAKPFSNALRVLSSDKDLFIEFLSEPFCLPQKCIKNLQNCGKSDRRSTLKAELQNGSVSSFSVREMKRKLKHTFRSSRRKEANALPRVEREPLVSETKTVRKKIDFSSGSLSFCSKHDVDVSSNGRTNLQKQWRALSSFGTDSCLSPRRESHYIGSAQVSLSPCRPSKETSPSLVPSTDDVNNVINPPTPNMKSNGDIRHSEKASKIELDVQDSISEEHRSPVSVLDQFFADDNTSPSGAAFQSARGPLKPRRLRFEEHEPSSSSSSQDCTISNYVRLILKAASLNWDQLSAMRPLPENLLHPSLFDQAQFLMFDSHFDTRLLFDHINDVLLETKRTHFVSPYWPAFAKPRICSLPLEEAVTDEIMREAEFYMLPRTQSRTLDQLLAIDFSSSRPRPDFRNESEQIIVHISEDILEESVLDVVLQLYS